MTVVDNHVFPNGLKHFLQGDVNVLADTIKAVLVTSAYVQSDAHEFLSDVPGGARVATSPAFSSKTTATPTAGVFNAAAITCTAVAAGSTITGVVIYKDTGVAGTSPLLVWLGKNGDSTPIKVATNNGSVIVTWSAGQFRIFSL